MLAGGRLRCGQGQISPGQGSPDCWPCPQSHCCWQGCLCEVPWAGVEQLWGRANDLHSRQLCPLQVHEIVSFPVAIVKGTSPGLPVTSLPSSHHQIIISEQQALCPSMNQETLEFVCTNLLDHSARAGAQQPATLVRCRPVGQTHAFSSSVSSL